MKPWILLMIGAGLDIVVAGALLAAGFTAFGAFMCVVAVLGFGLALWMRGRMP